MKFMLVAAMLMISLQGFAIVGDGTLYNSDAQYFDLLISSSSNDHHVVLLYRHQDYGTLNYMVMWAEGTDQVEAWICSVVACSIVSEAASWTSDRLYVMFMDDGSLYSLSTSDARYVTQNYEGRGENWAITYLANHMRQDI